MEISIKTQKEEELIDITDKVKEIVKKSDVEFGTCLVYVPHATCGVIINENYDPSVCEDIINALNRIIPKQGWKHDKIDNNGHSHIKAAIIGPSKTIPIENGILKLGKWQGIALAEFDGPRERKVIVEVSED